MWAQLFITVLFVAVKICVHKEISYGNPQDTILLFVSANLERLPKATHAWENMPPKMYIIWFHFCRANNDKNICTYVCICAHMYVICICINVRSILGPTPKSLIERLGTRLCILWFWRRLDFLKTRFFISVEWVNERIKREKFQMGHLWEHQHWLRMGDNTNWKCVAGVVRGEPGESSVTETKWDSWEGLTCHFPDVPCFSQLWDYTAVAFA